MSSINMAAAYMPITIEIVLKILMNFLPILNTNLAILNLVVQKQLIQ